MAIQLTETAARRVRLFLDKDGGRALRLGVRKTGCSGWAYEVGLAREIGSQDAVFEDKGVTVIVDPASLPYLDGSSIDYVTEGLASSFRFDNPNATEACGCGESFTINKPA